jgi:hypothetical protein
MFFYFVSRLLPYQELQGLKGKDKTADDIQRCQYELAAIAAAGLQECSIKVHRVEVEYRVNVEPHEDEDEECDSDLDWYISNYC